MSHAYDAIHRGDPQQASHILSDHISATGFQRYRHHLPPEVPPLSTGRGPARGSTRRHTGTGRGRGRPRDVHVQPERGTYYEDVLGDSVDHSSSQDHPSGGHRAEPSHSTFGGGWGSWPQGTSGGGWGSRVEGTPIAGGGSFVEGTSAGGWGSWVEGTPTGAGGSFVQGSSAGAWDSWVETLQDQSERGDGGTEHSTLQYQTPLSGFTPFASLRNPWDHPPHTPVAATQEHGDASDSDDPPPRQQPNRRVKGRGRRCHTGSHIL